VRFREAVGGSVTPLVIELKGDPGAVRKFTEESKGGTMSSRRSTRTPSTSSRNRSNSARPSLARGVRALMRETDVKQLDGSTRTSNTVSPIC
jgi:hypothetical protein